MKSIIKSSVIFVISILETVKYASSILCYDCNSAYDPRCGSEFDPFSLGIVNCSLRDPLEHMPDLEPSVCRSIKMDIYGKVRVVRSCGYVTDDSLDDQPCQKRTNTDQLFITYCSCTTDLCNGGVARKEGFVSLLLAPLAYLVWL